MPARIYKPSRNAMQSGKGKSQDWVLEFEQASPRAADPLMGWTSTEDTTTQVKLKFPTLAAAHAFAAPANARPSNSTLRFWNRVFAGTSFRAMLR